MCIIFSNIQISSNHAAELFMAPHQCTTVSIAVQVSSGAAAHAPYHPGWGMVPTMVGGTPVRWPLQPVPYMMYGQVIGVMVGVTLPVFELHA